MYQCTVQILYVFIFLLLLSSVLFKSVLCTILNNLKANFFGENIRFVAHLNFLVHFMNSWKTKFQCDNDSADIKSHTHTHIHKSRQKQSLRHESDTEKYVFFLSLNHFTRKMEYTHTWKKWEGKCQSLIGIRSNHNLTFLLSLFYVCTARFIAFNFNFNFRCSIHLHLDLKLIPLTYYCRLEIFGQAFNFKELSFDFHKR